MRLFWRQLLSRHLTPQTFSGLNFSVLGLGDSSYAKFNYTAKRLYRRLEGLGEFRKVGFVIQKVDNSSNLRVML